MSRKLWLFFLLGLLLPVTLWAQLASDGPYIWRDSVGTVARIVSVTPEGELMDRRAENLRMGEGLECASQEASFMVRTEDGQHQFSVQLHEVARPAAVYPAASQVFVMSDPHGNFDCFQSLLKAAGVIDQEYHWAFADGHLVVIGDVMDRGVDVTPIYWLLYELEAEAQQAGGRVSFLLGNHETLVLMNDVRYTERKYLTLADTLGMKCADLYGPQTELGRWLTTRNTLMRIGRDLFVHAGLSPQFYELGMSIDSLNATITSGLYKTKAERRAQSELVYTLFASDGPIWYRGLVREDEKFHPASADSLQLILDRYEADRLFVGHTIFPEVTEFYGGKVIGVNVDNKKARREQRTRGVLIRGGEALRVKDIPLPDAEKL